MSKSYQARKELFDAAVKKFVDLENPTADDYLEFIVEAQKPFKQGVGLSWEDIQEVVRNRVK